MILLILGLLAIPSDVVSFIGQEYQTILNRPVTTVERDDWSRRISRGRATCWGFYRTQFNGQEYLARQRNNVQYVTDLYASILFRQPDAGGLTFWTGILDTGTSDRDGLQRAFLTSSEFQGIRAQLGYFYLTPTGAGPFVAGTSSTFTLTDKLVLTPFFYWYDLPDTSFLRDGPTRPQAYSSLEWFEDELADMNAAGIDIALPVYWGYPDGEHAANSWSNGSLGVLAQALENTSAHCGGAPKIGMFYDTSTLQWNPHGRVDLHTQAGREIFWQTVRDFWSRIPPKYWAQIDGKPVIVLYSAVYAAGYDQGAFDYLRQQFQSQFSRQLFIIREESWNVTSEASYRWGAALSGPQITASVASIGPGFDDTLIRPVPQVRGRGDYAADWDTAIASGRKLIMIETWNEWYEASEICRSQAYGTAYIDQTRAKVNSWKIP